MNKEATVRVVSAVAYMIGKDHKDMSKQAAISMGWLKSLVSKLGPAVAAAKPLVAPVTAGTAVGYAGRTLQDKLTGKKPEGVAEGPATAELLKHLGNNAEWYGLGTGAAVGGGAGYGLAQAAGGSATEKLLSALTGAGLVGGAGYFAGQAIKGQPAAVAGKK